MVAGKAHRRRNEWRLQTNELTGIKVVKGTREDADQEEEEEMYNDDDDEEGKKDESQEIGGGGRKVIAGEEDGVLSHR